VIRAYRYHRFSSQRQDKGTSIERQHEATEALCLRHGWTIVETLEDKGRSAWKGDHLRSGELGKFRTRLEAGDIPPGSYLVIENLDRLSRQDIRTARRWIEDITDRQITVAVCRPEMLLDAAALSGANIGSMVGYLMEANRSTSESDRKSDFGQHRIAKFMEKARKGEVYTTRAPEWTEVHGTKLEPIAARVEVVRQILEWCADGIGYGSIAARLNRRGLPCWTRSKIWTVGYVRRIVFSPAIEGEYHVREGDDRTPTGEVIEGYYPRVADADLVARARAAVAKRRKTGGARHDEAQNLFAGVLHCADCGGGMTRSATGKEGFYVYVYCRNNKVGVCGNSTNYRYDRFERAALTQMLHLALDSRQFIRTDEIGPLNLRLATALKDVSRLEAEQANLLVAIRQLATNPALIAELGRIEDEINKARAAMVEAQAALDLARGNVSPEEHLRRVHGVRDAINSEDALTREQARRRVREAVQALVRFVSFDRIWIDNLRKQKRITMVLRGNHHGWIFDGDGNVLEMIDYTGFVTGNENEQGQSARMIGLSDEPEAERKKLTDIIRRSSKPVNA